MALLVALFAAGAASAQDFPDHRAAAVDQYGEPTPTPTPTPAATPAATPGAGAQAAQSTPAPAGSEADDGAGASRGNGDDDDDRGGSGGDPSGLGVAPDSAGNARGGAGAAGDVVPLTDSRGGRLPFTGLDLLTVVLLGCMLIAMGSLLALATRRRRDERSAA